MRDEYYIALMKSEIAPALGCTEPIAVAYASAKAREILGCMPEKAVIYASRNILKNAMGVGIPGTSKVGVAMAVALGVIGGRCELEMEVLRDVTDADAAQAEIFAENFVSVQQKKTPKKLFIEVELEAGKDSARVIVEDDHTNVTRIERNGELLYEKNSEEQTSASGPDKSQLTVAGIYDFITQVNVEKLAFLQDAVDMNWSIAQEGLKGNYGLCVGQTMIDSMNGLAPGYNVQTYAAGVAAAAADARMAGSKFPVMTVCGSGNQGITAILPVAAVVNAMGGGREQLYRALALSCLVTIHVKQYIGKLSPLCGCGMGSSIGVSSAITYIKGGGREQIEYAIQNMVADVSGIICDGAKAGCALKIGTVVNSAFMNSMLALRNHSVGGHDGIVSADVEDTIRHLGELGEKGMAEADQVILDMMVGK